MQVRYLLFTLAFTISGCTSNQQGFIPLEEAAHIPPPQSEQAKLTDDEEPSRIVVTGTAKIGKAIIIKIPFVTDRNVTSLSPAKLNDGDSWAEFGGSRGSKLNFGISYVSVPLHKHTVGNIERPRWWKLERVADPARHFVLQGNKILNIQEWRNTIKSFYRSPRKPVLLFVHGYNVTFESAAMRAAQMAWDLRFPGPVILYSWASAGKVASYPADEATAELSTNNLKKILQVILVHIDSKEVYLVSHSMGNRILGRSLVEFDDKALLRPKIIKDIVLAAPDIDADVFNTQIAPNLSKFSDRITLYASSTDEALIASKIFHGGYKRVGDTMGGVTIFPGIDTIDASSEGSDFFGHSYISDSPRVLLDLRNLIMTGRGPTARGMRPIRSASGLYWRFPSP